MSKVYFIGAGPGDPELITVKGKSLIETADAIIYAGSLVNPEILKYAKPGAVIHDSKNMELGPMVALMAGYAAMGRKVARVHTGDPSLFGAIAEQMAELDKAGVEYEVVPGVSSAFAAAAALKCELTLPDVNQTVIFTRLEGRTGVPKKESLSSLAKHRATMVIFLSIKMIEDVAAQLIEGGYPGDTPAAVVFKASWPEQRIITGSLNSIAGDVKLAGIDKTALIFVGEAIEKSRMVAYSKLYDKDFNHEFRS
jgi:precorrin-4/cobalt-precorrin-4 C11-methyltransferase